MCAIEGGQEEVVVALLFAGADLNIKNKVMHYLILISILSKRWEILLYS